MKGKNPAYEIQLQAWTGKHSGVTCAYARIKRYMGSRDYDRITPLSVQRIQRAQLRLLKSADNVNVSNIGEIE